MSVPCFPSGRLSPGFPVHLDPGVRECVFFLKHFLQFSYLL